MKIGILLGRGTEGCGVTQCAIQMQIVTGATILSCVDKKWPRGKKIEFPGEYVEFKLKNGIDDELVTQLNSYDLVVVYSVPSKGHPQETQDNFLKLLRRVNVRKSFINVDHNAQSISRNANLKEIVSEVDVAMTHSLSNPFSLWHAKEGISTPLRKMRLGFDFDGHRKKYWKDATDDLPIEMVFSYIQYVSKSDWYKKQKKLRKRFYFCVPKVFMKEWLLEVDTKAEAKTIQSFISKKQPKKLENFGNGLFEMVDNG